jgi:perosamine synthetase
LIKEDRVSAWHLYVIKLRTEALAIDRNIFSEKMNEQGIGTSVHFIPLHRHPFYRASFKYFPQDFPVAEQAFERILSLPIYPGMTNDQVDRVISTVRDIAFKNKR